MWLFEKLTLCLSWWSIYRNKYLRLKNMFFKCILEHYKFKNFNVFYIWSVELYIGICELDNLLNMVIYIYFDIFLRVYKVGGWVHRLGIGSWFGCLCLIDRIVYLLSSGSAGCRIQGSRLGFCSPRFGLAGLCSN